MYPKSSAMKGKEGKQVLSALKKALDGPYTQRPLIAVLAKDETCQ